jgi:hypothetical protein
MAEDEDGTLLQATNRSWLLTKRRETPRASRKHNLEDRKPQRKANGKRRARRVMVRTEESRNEKEKFEHGYCSRYSSPMYLALADRGSCSL